MALKIIENGSPVKKITGDYQAVGHVAGHFYINGKLRYNVTHETSAGLLTHIYSPANIIQISHLDYAAEMISFAKSILERHSK